MIGVIPAGTKTFEVMGDFNSDNLIEGKLYYHPDTKRLYYYSLSETRSSASNGYFPCWNGSREFVTTFSNCKYLQDVINNDIGALSSSINDDVAESVKYNQRRATNDTLLKPPICDGDNFATQTVKGVICAMNLTIIDLFDMCDPKLSERTIENYYASLTKITFMRIDKWKIWLSTILHVKYIMQVYDDEKKLLTYYYPEDRIDTGIVKYDQLINKKSPDTFKKIVHVLMAMKSITKATLRSDEVNDYDTNNLMTTLNSNKPLSAQLFSRFMRMAHLGFVIRLYNMNDQFLFEFSQGR